MILSSLRVTLLNQIRKVIFSIQAKNTHTFNKIGHGHILMEENLNIKLIIMKGF